MKHLVVEYRKFTLIHLYPYTVSRVLMSARDQELAGFETKLIASMYGNQTKKVFPPRLSRSTISVLLDLASSMKIEPIELFNAIDIIARMSADPQKRDISPLFYAAIRLSVFWRRRKDVLSVNRNAIMQDLTGRGIQVSEIMEAESDILAFLGCHICRSYCNVLEVTMFCLNTVITDSSLKDEKKKVLDVAVDLCTITSCTDITLTDQLSVWYVKNLPIVYLNAFLGKHRPLSSPPVSRYAHRPLFTNS